MTLHRWLAASVLLATSVVGVTAASAQPAPPTPAPTSVEVRVGETASFPLPRRPMIIDSENRAVATLVVMPDGTARVTGVAAGATRIVGQDAASLPMIFPVTVLPARAR